MKQYKYYSIITGIFCASLVISNILDTKIFQLGSSAFPSGIILFPIVYVFGDILTEVYGYAQSRKVIWSGFFSLAILVLSLQVANILPPASFWNHQSEFETLLGKIPRIVVASLIAYFAGEFSNSFILAKMKIRQKGKSMAVRFATSTFVGQAIDTAFFIIIAFAGTMATKNMLNLFISAWLFKVSWELIALPISVPLVKWLKVRENEDYYDKDTNFTPFKIS